MTKNLSVRAARPDDIPLILELIGELAMYEKLAHEAKATPEQLHQALFAPRPYAEVLIGSVDTEPAGFALFFHNFSTFLGQPGLYLEDLFVRSEYRGCGLGKALLRELARLAVARNCGRMEWSVLNWNKPAIAVYEAIGAHPQDEWTVYRLTGQNLLDFAATDRQQT